MNIYCINHNFLYETEKLLFLFLPFEKNTCLDTFDGDNGDYFYGDDTTRHSLGVAIEIMRKYKKIQEIVKKWELDSWTDNLSYESMIQIREVLEDGNDD